MEIDGEMQVDAALLPDLAERKAPQSSSPGAPMCSSSRISTPATSP